MRGPIPTLISIAAVALAAVVYFTFYTEFSVSSEHSYHPSSDEKIEPKLKVVTDSPMFRGNAAHTGYYPGGLGRQKAREKDKEIVFVGSDDKHVYAFNAKTGMQLWRTETGGEVWGSPAVVNGLVFICSGDGWLYALKAKTGQILWKVNTEWEVFSTPAVADGKVFVNQELNHLFAFKADTGEQLWKLGMGGEWGSPGSVSKRHNSLLDVIG